MLSIPHRDNAIDRRAETEETAPKTIKRTREANDDKVWRAEMPVIRNCFVTHPNILQMVTRCHEYGESTIVSFLKL